MSSFTSKVGTRHQCGIRVAAGFSLAKQITLPLARRLLQHILQLDPRLGPNLLLVALKV